MVISGCAEITVPLPTPTLSQSPVQRAELTLDQIEFSELKQWNSENFASVLPAFVRSCDKIEKRNPKSQFGKDERMGTVAEWIAICKDARNIRPGNKIEAKYFFETRFVAYVAGNLSEPDKFGNSRHYVCHRKSLYW